MMLDGPIKGVLAVILAGFSNGSFPAPSKGITAWKWEHIWLVYSFCAMAVLPVGLALLFSHGTIARQLATDPELALKVAAFGALWGIGSLLFGVSLVRLGMAITNALVNGIVAFLGSLGPILIGSVHVDRGSLLWLIGGLTLLALSLALCTAASITRDRAQGILLSSSGSRSQSIGAVFIAVMAGVMSAMINIGFVYGAPLANSARAAGCPALLASVTIWIPVLLGGLIFNMGYPAYLISRRSSWPTFFRGRKNTVLWVRCSFMGVLWFGAILLYGIGASIIGNEGAVYGWALIVAVSILTSSTWGAVTGEWKDSGAKPKVLMWLSTALLISSLILLAGHQLSR
jgi:L-rhamnose-H+ transport protein